MTTDERIALLLQSAVSHDRQIGELTEGLDKLKNTVATQTANINKLVRVTNQDATAIRTLARLASAQDARIAAIEAKGGKRQ